MQAIIKQLQDIAETVDPADMIDALANALMHMTEAHPEAVRPGAVHDVCEAFVEMSNVGYGLNEGPERTTTWAGFHNLDAEPFGHILMNVLGDPDEIGKEDKVRAALVADEIGPDYAQKLYRFTVLVTKLA